MEWWHWLFETERFRPPGPGLALPTGLVWATLASAVMTFLVFSTITVFLLMFLWQGGQPRFFRDRTTALAFAALTGVTGLNALVRALMFAWPAYRFHALTAGIAAAVAWGVVALMLPVAMYRQVNQLREERHAFANKVNAETLAMTAGMMRLENIQKEMLRQVHLIEHAMDERRSPGVGG